MKNRMEEEKMLGSSAFDTQPEQSAYLIPFTALRAVTMECVSRHTWYSKSAVSSFFLPCSMSNEVLKWERHEMI